MSEQQFQELTAGEKSLAELTFEDFKAFSKERIEQILAGTNIPLNRQAQLLRLHSEKPSHVGAVPAKEVPKCRWPADAIQKFEDMNLRQEILHGIKTFGLEIPAPIQQSGIAPITAGNDVILQAPFGAGKTVGVAIGLIQRLDPQASSPQCLMVCPSHEEAEHCSNLVAHVGEFLAEGKPHFSAPFIGRCPVDWDDEKLRSGVAFAAGTPARLLNLLRRNAIRASELKAIAFVNMDDLLYDFSGQTYAMARSVPQGIQFIMTTTTMPPEAMEFAHWYLKEPKHVVVDESPVPDGIKQFRVSLPDSNDARFDRLYEIIKDAGETKTVVFCNTRWKVNWVAEKLQAKQIPVAVVHADRMRNERDKDYDAFKHGEKKVLVLTEKLAAGADTEAVKLVINMDLPFSDESYLLRIGRFGRFGHKACVVNFENPGEIGKLGWYETRWGIHMEDLPSNFKDCYN